MDRFTMEPGRAPLVGRARELAFIAEHADRAAAGEPQIVLVEGEPGLGKTRVLEASVDALARERWTILRGDADELPSPPPYGPFVAALRSWSDAVGVERARVAAGRWAPHLAAVMPELDDEATPADPGGRSAGATRPDAEVLAEGWAQVLRAVAGAGPVVVAIDDFQWADAASRDLLRYLRRRLRGTPLLVICADRGEAPDGSAGGQEIETLARARLATVLRLGRIDGDASRALAEHLVGGPVGADLDRVVQGEGEGHPLIIEELLRGLADAGRIVRVGRVWDLEGPAPAGLPRGVRDALGSRLASLPQDAVLALRAGSVVGRRFSTIDVARLIGASVSGAAALLAEAGRRRFIRPLDDGWEFTHDKIRETLYADLADDQRRRWHEAMAETVTATLPIDARRLAFHAVQGGNAQQAIPALLAVARAARAAAAWSDACDALASVVRISRTLGDDRRLATGLLDLGACLTDAGRYDAAVDALTEALRLAGPPGQGAVAAGALEHLAAVHLAREHADAARAAGDAALDAISQATGRPDDGLTVDEAAAAEVRVHLLLARLEVSVTGRLSQGVASAMEAQRLAHARREPLREAEALALLGQAAMHAGDFELGRERFGQAAALADAVRDPALAADTADGLARLLYWTSAFNQAAAAATRELEAARETGDPHRLGWPTFWLAQCALCLGDWNTVRTRGKELVDLGTQLGARRFEGQGHELLALAAYWTGDAEGACAEFATALRHLRLIGSGTLVYYLGPYGLALVAAGRTAEATAVDAELRALARGFAPATSPRVQAFNVAARLRLALGRPEPGDAGELVAAERQHHWYPVASTLALLALQDRPDLAARHAAVARAVITADGGSAHLAELLLIEGRLALRRGDRREADRLEDESTAFVARWGIAPAAVRAALPAVIAGEQPMGGALSGREEEVLGLVARGLTNREIADALSITEKTVINHVTHILDKLGVANRAAAAAWAVRSGLAGR